LKSQCDAIETENKKLFRQQTLYDAEFVRFMHDVYDKVLPARLRAAKGDFSSATKSSLVSNATKVLMRFVFNVVAAKVRAPRDVKKWWGILRSAMIEANDERPRSALKDNMLNSKVLPSYLMNLFGKTQSAENRAAAQSFFEDVIKAVARRRAESAQKLFRKLLDALVVVVEHWAPLLLRTSMAEVVALIVAVDAQSPSEDHSYLLPVLGRLLSALKQLMTADFEYIAELGANTPDSVFTECPRSESNLDVRAICDLLWRLMELHRKHVPQTKGSEAPCQLLNDAPFLRSLIARDYFVSQVHIVRAVVAANSARGDLRCFETVTKAIHLRLSWLDFYEVWGALNVFNGLFDAAHDELLAEKLQGGVFRTHLQKMVANLRYFQLSKVSILLLSQLCSNNEVVRAWIHEHCFGELEAIGEWCQKHKKFSHSGGGGGRGRNRRGQQQQPQVAFYRQLKHFEGKEKGEMMRWKKEMNAKVNLKNLANGQESLVQAFNAINRRD